MRLITTTTEQRLQRLLLFVMAACAAWGCSEGPCSDHDSDPRRWECWVEIDGLEEPYRTERVVAEMRRERGGPHQVLLADPPDFSDADAVADAIFAADEILSDGYSLRDNPVIDVILRSSAMDSARVGRGEEAGVVVSVG